jgi:hypothetical protein
VVKKPVATKLQEMSFLTSKPNLRKDGSGSARSIEELAECRYSRQCRARNGSGDGGGLLEGVTDVGDRQRTSSSRAGERGRSVVARCKRASQSRRCVAGS